MNITLKAARVNAGLTQKEVSAATGHSRSTLIRWENGITSPKVKDLQVLCKLYGIPKELIKY